jgi:hypothetical protein
MKFKIVKEDVIELENGQWAIKREDGDYDALLDDIIDGIYKLEGEEAIKIG